MASGGLAVRTQSFTPRPGAPKYLISALKDIGKDERKYRKYFNDEIKQWLGYDFDVAKDPWCAVWIGVELEEAGYTSTKKANARSYLTWGAATEENSWSEGDIVVLWRGQRDDGVFGHIGFLLNYDEDYVYLLGGNQGDKVCIQRFSRSKILDVRRPRNPWFTRTVKASAAQVAAGSAVVINETTKTVPVEAIAQTKSLLEQAIQYLPSMTQSLGLMAIALGAYIIFRRIRDMKETGR